MNAHFPLKCNKGFWANARCLLKCDESFRQSLLSSADDYELSWQQRSFMMLGE